MAGAATAAACVLLPASGLAAEEDAPLATEAARIINLVRQSTAGCASTGRAKAGALSPGAAARPRPVLRWNTRLAVIADGHSRAMAARLFFDHVDENGRDIAWRANAGGYRWRLVGENIAAGQASLEEAVQDWVASEAHCRNLLDERYAEFGLARVEGRRADDPYGVYWTLVLARPASAPQTIALQSTR